MNIGAKTQIDAAIRNYRRWHGVSARTALRRMRIARWLLRLALYTLVGVKRPGTGNYYPEAASSVDQAIRCLDRQFEDLRL